MDKLHVLENHIAFKKTSVKAEEKLKDIKRYLSMFLNSTKKPLSKLTEQDLVKFLNSLDYSIRTMNDIKTYIKVFIKWHYHDWSSRFRNLEKLCKLQTPPRAYEPEQLIKIKDLERIVKGEKDLMWKVYWLVFFYGGFRPSEACKLTWDQIYFEPEGVIIKIRTSKTKKDFYKSLPNNAENLLKQWKEYNDSHFIFPSPHKDGDCIRARTVCQRLKRLSKRILGREIVPYALRHSVATILYSDNKRKDDDTANQLGHNKSMKNTYMNLSGEELKARARKLWIKAKDMSPSKKEELERKIDRMEKAMKNMEKEYNKIQYNIEKAKNIVMKDLLKKLRKNSPNP